MIATAQRSVTGRTLAGRSSAAPTKTAFNRARPVQPVAATAKEFVEEISTIPGKIRCIAVGDGAILETVALLGKPHYNDTSKGELATFKNEDSSFEAHIYLSTVSDAKIVKAKSKHGSHDTYSIRLYGLDKQALISFFLDSKSPDAASIKAWEAVQQKFGEEVTFDLEGNGEAMFSFSDA